MQRQRIPFTYESLKIKYEYPVRCNPCVVCGNTNHHISRVYNPDFGFNKNAILLELKGKLDREDRKKYEAVKKCNPTLDIRFLFMRNNRIRPRSETYYSDWAVANGFPYCIGEISKEWIKEIKDGYKQKG